MVEMSGGKNHQRIRYVPLVENLKIRTAIGFILLVLSSTLAGTILGKGSIAVIVPITAFAWMLAVFLTDKYVQKYSQRYFPYLIASHLKAAIIMAFFLLIMGKIAGILTAPHDVLWTGYIFFVFTDALASVPRCKDMQEKQISEVVASLKNGDIPEYQSSDSGYTDKGLPSIDTQAIVRQIRSDVDKLTVDFIEKNLPELKGSMEDVQVLDDVTSTSYQPKTPPVGLLISRIRINDVRRLNQFCQYCAKNISMGGFFVGRYMPLENFGKDLKRRYTGILYWPVFIFNYIWYRAFQKIPWLDDLYFSSKLSWLDDFYFSLAKRRNRVLSKAEVWGRLAFCGMNVIAETPGDGERYIMAQLESLPTPNKRPSYYPIVALEKVGLDGDMIRTHKVRTMFPFSEFIQKRIFEDYGLASTGKFANDYRLTGLGIFLRKYWLDELPQIFDWLRGDIKLVGIRATSRHFLSLYPKDFLGLYVQIKPGLIPPIFDENTNGFDQIVEIEQAYLQRYWERPFRTDVSYLFQTFTDIVFRGIRSK